MSNVRRSNLVGSEEGAGRLFWPEEEMVRELSSAQEMSLIHRHFTASRPFASRIDLPGWIQRFVSSDSYSGTATTRQASWRTSGPVVIIVSRFHPKPTRVNGVFITLIPQR